MFTCQQTPCNHKTHLSESNKTASNFSSPSGTSKDTSSYYKVTLGELAVFLSPEQRSRHTTLMLKLIVSAQAVIGTFRQMNGLKANWLFEVAALNKQYAVSI